MRALTTVVIAVAIVLVVVVGLLVRSERGDTSADTGREARHSPSTRQEKSGGQQQARSARVEERLQRLREKTENHGGERDQRLAAPPERQVARADGRALLPTPKSRAGTGGGADEDEVKLVETIRTSPDPEERASAVFFLSGGDSKTVLPVLLDAMKDSDPDVRLAVVEALDDYSDEIDPDILAPVLNDPSAEVRFEALGIVGDMDDDARVRSIASKMLNDPDDEVRSLAEGILDMDDDA